MSLTILAVCFAVVYKIKKKRLTKLKLIPLYVNRIETVDRFLYLIFNYYLCPQTPKNTTQYDKG